MATGDCVDWTMYRNRDGYGELGLNGKKVKAHRVAYCRHHGIDLADIAGMVVRHKCDRPCCVNPEHLELGTQQDNIRDATERRRFPRKLSDEEVADIRARYRKGSRDSNIYTLAKEYGSCPQHIHDIVRKAKRVD